MTKCVGPAPLQIIVGSAGHAEGRQCKMCAKGITLLYSNRLYHGTPLARGFDVYDSWTPIVANFLYVKGIEDCYPNYAVCVTFRAVLRRSEWVDGTMVPKRA